MADNYLEKRQAEIAEGGRKVVRRTNPSLDTLLHRNRSYRGYDPSRKVTEEELRKLVSAATLAATGMNRQPLRYRLVTEADAGLVLPHITLGAALPEEHLPKPGTEPRAFIVICSSVPEDRVADIDLGFAGQSILLKAVEMGLGGIISRSRPSGKAWRSRWIPSPSSPSANQPRASTSSRREEKTPTFGTTERTRFTSYPN